MRPITLERFSTAAAAPGEGLGYWNALASQVFNNLSIDAAEPAAFVGRMATAPLGAISLMSADSSAARVSRMSDPTRAARGLKAFDLHFQLTGSSLNVQAGREAVLDAGDFTLCDASQPYCVRFDERNHMLCLKLPAPLVEARLGEVEELLCRPMAAGQGGAAMLSGFLQSVWARLDQGEQGDEAWGETVADVIFDLLGLAYRPLRRDADEAGQRETRRREAHVFIQGRLCDPELDVGAVAAALGVTPRYVQKLFAETGNTPSAYILERRLELAAQRLRLGVGRGGVTQVALGVGFNDLTHFGRAFRRRFGVSPSDYTSGARVRPWIAGRDSTVPRTQAVSAE